MKKCSFKALAGKSSLQEQVPNYVSWHVLRGSESEHSRLSKIEEGGVSVKPEASVSRDCIRLREEANTF